MCACVSGIGRGKAGRDVCMCVGLVCVRGCECECVCVCVCHERQVLCVQACVRMCMCVCASTCILAPAQHKGFCPDIQAW